MEANVKPGVYNVIVQYAASNAPPAVRLDVSDGRHLQDRFQTIAPRSQEGGASMTTQSLGPLAFQHDEVVEFRLGRADLREEASIDISGVLLKPVEGTQPSTVKSPSAAVPQETPHHINPVDGAEMVWVPQGGFTMGGGWYRRSHGFPQRILDLQIARDRAAIPQVLPEHLTPYAGSAEVGMDRGSSHGQRLVV